MKIKYLYPSILILIVLLLGCEKQDYTREDIIGDWLLEGILVKTKYTNGVVKDTVLSVGTDRYLINESDTLTITSLEYNSSLSYLLEYHSPNTLIIYSCPFEFLCITNTPYHHKIVTLNNHEMIWEIVNFGPDKKTMETYTFIK